MHRISMNWHKLSFYGVICLKMSLIGKNYPKLSLCGLTCLNMPQIDKNCPPDILGRQDRYGGATVRPALRGSTYSPTAQRKKAYAKELKCRVQKYAFAPM